MDHPTEDRDSQSLDSPVDTVRIERMQAVLTQIRLALVQQILASDSGALSVEELNYRNTDIKESTIDYHLRKLSDNNIVTALKADNPANDLPNTYWAVTETGISLLQQLGFYSDVEILSEADRALTRTARIEEIEAFTGRPEPEWYEPYDSSQ